MLDIRGASRKVSDSSACTDAYTPASEVILSYGGLYHQFSRPGSGAAGVGSAARIYPRRLCTRERVPTGYTNRVPFPPPYRSHPMSHNTTITRNNLTPSPLLPPHPHPRIPTRPSTSAPSFLPPPINTRAKYTRRPFFDT